MEDSLKSICADIRGKDNKDVNAAIYVDYENVLMRLREYNLHPVNDLDLFKNIAEEIRGFGINIVKYIAYANFDDFDLKKTDQSKIQSFGVDTRHTSRLGKSSSDIDLIVDALYDLYKNSNIHLFIIMSNDKDYIPLLKAIRLENKTTLLISTRNGFNESIKIFANYHVYIENIFSFKSKKFSIDKAAENNDIGLPVDEVTPDIKSNV